MCFKLMAQYGAGRMRRRQPRSGCDPFGVGIVGAVFGVEDLQEEMHSIELCAPRDLRRSSYHARSSAGRGTRIFDPADARCAPMESSVLQVWEL